MLTENKFSKYLLYAIGEIILVVIGILIALYFNRRSELAQSEKKIEIILLEVLDELSTNTKTANNGLEFSFAKDSLFNKVTQNRMSNKYVSNNLDDLMDLTTYYNYGVFSQNGYDNLISNLNIVPNEYKPILKKLNRLYGGTTRFVYKYNDIIEEMANNNISKRADNYEWFSNSENPVYKQAMINYIQNDYKYQNEVEHFYRISTIHDGYLMNYINESLQTYNDIALILNVPTLNSYSDNKNEAAKLFVGEWKTTSYPDYGNFVFKINDKLLYSYSTSDTTYITNEHILSTQKLNSKTIVNILNELNFWTYIIDGDTINASSSNETFQFVRINKN